MEDKKVIQAYVNDFRRHMSKFLKKSVGLACKAYPSSGDGGVIEFKIGPNLSSDDEITEVQQSINDVLKAIPQKIVGGNIDRVKFGGTNISMEPDRILIIKGEDDIDLWSDTGALNDVNKIIANVTKNLTKIQKMRKK